MPGATFGSLTLTFSPPVSGFSFLARNFNAQPFTNSSRITVSTTTGNVSTPVLTQTDGDINFVGWFEAGSSVTSVTLAPLAFKFSSSKLFSLEMALDELRVYTQCSACPSGSYVASACNQTSDTVCAGWQCAMHNSLYI